MLWKWENTSLELGHQNDISSLGLMLNYTVIVANIPYLSCLFALYYLLIREKSIKHIWEGPVSFLCNHRKVPLQYLFFQYVSDSVILYDFMKMKLKAL